MSLTVKCLILSLMLFAPHAFAGPDENQCKQSSQQNANDCKQAGNAAESANSAQAGAAGAAANTRGNTINPNSGALKQVTSDGQQRLQQASQRCKEDKKKCDDDCDQAKKMADQKAAQTPCTAACQAAKQDQAQIPETRKNDCDGAILPIIAMLDGGASGNGSGSQQAGNTGGQSGAMPPIPPIPPSSSSKDQPSPQVGTGTLSPVSTACTASDPTAATNPNCQDLMIAQCGPGGSMVNAPKSPCGSFTANYCNAVQGTQFPTAQSPNSIRPGSGVGSQYCQNAVAGTFCQDATHANCATCQSYRGLSVDATLAASCPTVEPPLTSNPVTAPTTGGDDLMFGSGGGISGGGSAGGGLPSTSQANLPATKEGAEHAKSGLPSLNMAVSEGGGSGSSSGDTGGDHDYTLGKFAGFSLGGRHAKPGAGTGALAANRAPASTEVAAVNSPSLFNISSAAIQNMCSHNKLKHCGNN